MARDVYVMPLWRFKAGEFETPVQRHLGTGARYRLVSLADGLARHWPQPRRWSARRKARKTVAAMKRKVAEANGIRADWRDEGELVYSEQFLFLEGLRAFARYLDFRDGLASFEEPPHSNYDEHPAMRMEYDDRICSCPHLLNGTYYLPCEFDQTVSVETVVIRNRWTFYHHAASSPRLRDELRSVNEHLNAPWRRDNVEAIPPGDPLFLIKDAFAHLWEVCELSCRHGLPITFWS